MNLSKFSSLNYEVNNDYVEEGLFIKFLFVASFPLFKTGLSFSTKINT
jgi:hypothetical protein